MNIARTITRLDASLRTPLHFEDMALKNSVLPLVCLLIGGAAGYGLRSVDLVAKAAAMSRMPGTAGAGQAGAANAFPAASGTKKGQAQVAETKNETAPAAPSGAVAGSSLDARMSELLADYEYEKAKTFAKSLSAADLQAALALAAAKPKSNDRDSLRWNLYRAWGELNPAAAWKAALADPLDTEGNLLAAAAGGLAKTKPQEAIELALSLGMGGRRSAVLREVMNVWGKEDMPAVVAYWNAHPQLPVEYYAISGGFYNYAEKDPLQAANLVLTLKDVQGRSYALSNLMNTWAGRDPAAALNWAQALTNPTMRQDAIAAAVGGWANINPAEAMAHAESIQDPTTRANALRNAWDDWFRKEPAAATAYLGTAGNEKLLQNMGWNFGYLTQSFTPQERNELLAQIPEGKAKDEIVRNLTYNQISRGQYNQALELLNAMPDSSQRDNSVEQLGERWAAADLEAATAWLKLQPDSSDRDLAVAGFARTLARSDPVAAVEWANTIPDEKVREPALKNIAIRWLATDSAKAETWMAGVTAFSEADKKSLRDGAARYSGGFSYSATVSNRR